jgi:iron(III) transport system permease protein
MIPGRRRSRAGIPAVTWVLLGAIGAMMVYPVSLAALRVIGGAWTGPSTLLAGTNAASLAHVLWNTCVVVIGGAVLALLAGCALACVNERTDAGLGRFAELLPLAPLMVPPIAGVIGWAALLDPNAGLLNALIRTALAALGVTITDGPFNIYSFPGLIAMTGLSLVPYVYLVIAAALRRLDPAMEEASRVCGTPPLRTLIRVTLPAIAPAVAGAFLIALVAGIGLFSVPIVLGTAAKVDVISVYIFRLLDAYPPDLGGALVLAAFLSLVVQALLWAQRVIAPPGRQAAIGGRGTRAAPLTLGRWRAPARLLSILYLASTAVLPFAGLTVMSLQSFWTPTIDFGALSLGNYRDVLLDNATTRQALLNSFGLGAIVATLTMAIAAFVTLTGTSGDSRSKRIADRLMSLPATIPHTFIGISFLIAFSLPPFRLYGSVGILALAYMTMGLPFAARAAHATAGGIGRELAEASRVAGASEARTLWRVLLPLALPGLVAGWVIVFIHSAGELTASAFLSGPGNPVIGRVLMDFWVFGNFPQVAALAIIITAANVLCIAAMFALSRRSMRGAVG